MWALLPPGEGTASAHRVPCTQRKGACGVTLGVGVDRSVPVKVLDTTAIMQFKLDIATVLMLLITVVTLIIVQLPTLWWHSL